MRRKPTLGAADKFTIKPKNKLLRGQCGCKSFCKDESKWLYLENRNQNDKILIFANELKQFSSSIENCLIQILIS